MDKNDTRRSDPAPFRIAIVGASFSGLALAIALTRTYTQRNNTSEPSPSSVHQRRSIPIEITIFDSSGPLSRTSNVNEVVGPFILASGLELLHRLGLEHLNSKNHRAFTENGLLSYSLMRESNDSNDDIRNNQVTVDRLDLKRWLNNQCSSDDSMIRTEFLYDHRVVDYSYCGKRGGDNDNAQRQGLLYLSALVRHRGEDGKMLHNRLYQQQQQQQKHCYGPFDLLVGADGVLSTIRQISSLAHNVSTALAQKQVALLGDARWVHEYWYDFGYRRIQQGANLALWEGIEFGRLLLSELDDFEASSSSSASPSSPTLSLLQFGVEFVQGQRNTQRRRRITVLVLMLACLLAFKC